MDLNSKDTSNIAVMKWPVKFLKIISSCKIYTISTISRKSPDKKTVGVKDELFTRYTILFTRYWLLFTCYSLLFTRYSLLLSRYSLLLTRYSLLLTRYSLLFTRYLLLLSRYFYAKRFVRNSFDKIFKSHFQNLSEKNFAQS